MGRLLDSDVVKKALYDAVDDISRGYMTIYGIEEDDIEGIIDNVPSVQPTHTNTPNTLKSLDCVDRQAVKEMMCVKHCTAYPTCQQKYGCYKTHDLELLPSVQPYTEAQLQKIQDMEQAQLEKVFDLGRETAKAEIIHCGDCKHGAPNGKYGCKLYHYRLYETHEMKPDDFCSFAERRTDE